MNDLCSYSGSWLSPQRKMKIMMMMMKSPRFTPVVMLIMGFDGTNAGNTTLLVIRRFRVSQKKKRLSIKMKAK